MDCVSPAIEFQPDIIIAHSYRHLHTHQAVKIKKELSKIGKPCKIFLVTHAPFGSSFSRSFFQNLAVSFYDRFIGPRILNKFDNVITITKWEEPFLEDLDVNRSKIKYVPNGIPDEFFSKMKLNNSNQRLFFLGRIDPIKDLETLIYAMEKINVYLDIIGPSEGNYLQSLKNLTKELDIKNIQFNGPIYDLSDKINLIDDHSLFILPSKRESMPQSLIESMARGKIVISSDNFGGKEMIQNSRNGFLFPIGDSNQLSKLILYVLKLPKKEKKKYL
jgi:glycosyltransferase involved in cell wall biosynthesis